MKTDPVNNNHYDCDMDDDGFRLVESKSSLDKMNCGEKNYDLCGYSDCSYKERRANKFSTSCSSSLTMSTSVTTISEDTNLSDLIIRNDKVQIMIHNNVFEARVKYFECGDLVLKNGKQKKARKIFVVFLVLYKNYLHAFYY